MSPSSNSSDSTDDQVAVGWITPELALVSPELAEAGRAQLPSRPWEAAAGRLPTARRTRDPTADHRLLRLRRSSGRHLVPLVAAIGAAAVLIGFPASFPSLRGKSPTSVSDERITAGRSDEEAVRVVSGGKKVRGAPGGKNVGAAPRVDKPLLQPRGGYVVSPSGSLLTNGSGRKIQTFVLPLECAGRPLVVEGVPVSGRSFTFAGTALESAATVRLEVRILDARRVRGVVAAEGRGCPSASVTFLARLS